MDEAKPTELPTENQTETPDTSWDYHQDQEPAGLGHAVNPVEWTASEFVQHDKDSSWYVALGVLGVIVVGIIYLITEDWITAVVIVVAMILFAVAAKRKPRTLRYRIDHSGVTMGDKLYTFAQFKSFTVLQEGAFNSIMLMPLKRFMPPISLYCPPEQEEEVITTLGNYLPHETRSHDPVDRLMSKIRF